MLILGVGGKLTSSGGSLGVWGISFTRSGQAPKPDWLEDGWRTISGKGAASNVPSVYSSHPVSKETCVFSSEGLWNDSGPRSFSQSFWYSRGFPGCNPLWAWGTGHLP